MSGFDDEMEVLDLDEDKDELTLAQLFPRRPRVVLEGVAYEMELYGDMDAARQQIVVGTWGTYNDLIQRGWQRASAQQRLEEEKGDEARRRFAEEYEARHHRPPSEEELDGIEFEVEPPTKEELAALPKPLTTADLAVIDACRNAIIVIAIPDLPPDVRARLSPRRRDRIAQRFFALVVREQRMRRELATSIGATLSPASSASTAEIPAAG